MDILDGAALAELNPVALEDYRNAIVAERDRLTDSFREAGGIKAAKLADLPENKAKAKIAEGRAELEAAKAASSAEALGVDNG